MACDEGISLDWGCAGQNRGGVRRSGRGVNCLDNRTELVMTRIRTIAWAFALTGLWLAAGADEGSSATLRRAPRGSRSVFAELGAVRYLAARAESRGLMDRFRQFPLRATRH